MGVGEWFSDFCGNLRIGADQRSTIAGRTKRIVAQLNWDMRSLSSDSAYRFYVGSYGRGTAIPSVSDVDLLYEMPPSKHAQYDQYIGNGQSALLSEVRGSILKTYPSTKIGGDGQVVVVEFADGVKFEVLPSFQNQGGGYTFGDSNSGGSWKTCKPKQEMTAFAARNLDCNGNLAELARMARAWRDANQVPMSGMLIDTLAYQFIDTWAHKTKSYLYYDFLARDFFNFLTNLPSNQSYWLAPGSGSWVYGGGFHYKARQAELRVLDAISYQGHGHDWSAKNKYREVFGTAFPY
ncbi:SMODS domain-containing nucleotidyltransferase [Roseateles cavernae]|uniref:SMODS domain-containing nucleotidyltransferase n=1 Tax=Roseateles cavernae TaxID=3153578 RepID=UPI0032E5190C